MKTLITCPKCRGDLHPDFTAYCDKCNLDFTHVDPMNYAQVCDRHGVKFEQQIFNWECPACYEELIDYGDDEPVEDQQGSHLDDY